MLEYLVASHTVFVFHTSHMFTIPTDNYLINLHARPYLQQRSTLKATSNGNVSELTLTKLTSYLRLQHTCDFICEKAMMPDNLLQLSEITDQSMITT